MTEFHHAVEQYFLIQPSFKKYYQLTDKAQSAYSVTSLGIKRLMEMNGDAFSFYESRNSLQLAINQQADGSNLVAVIPASIFFPINNTFHYYAICNIKEHGENHLYIFDSR